MNANLKTNYSKDEIVSITCAKHKTGSNTNASNCAVHVEYCNMRFYKFLETIKNMLYNAAVTNTSHKAYMNGVLNVANNYFDNENAEIIGQCVSLWKEHNDNNLIEDYTLERDKINAYMEQGYYLGIELNGDLYSLFGLTRTLLDMIAAVLRGATELKVLQLYMKALMLD